MQGGAYESQIFIAISAPPNITYAVDDQLPKLLQALQTSKQTFHTWIASFKYAACKIK